MNTNIRSFKAFLLCLVAAIFMVPATMADTYPEPQAAAGPSGKLRVVGEVTVNGTSAISGATVFSDSTVTTAKGSSAVVSLGKLGRVEVLPESTMKLSFTDSGIMVSMLEAGRVRISSSSGTSAKTTTNDGEAIATGPKMNEFSVDTSCGNTLVAVKKGSVELRAGGTVKQIAAGSQDSAGTARPGCTPGGSRN
jgi:ferric-dicitrate binding protein FerR (iron transport regulator)